MTHKTALITGISGMDACTLASLLLEKGYKVFGTTRHCASRSFWRLEEEGILNSIEIVEGDLTDQSCLENLLKTARPDEIYSLAALSFVGASWITPITMMEITGLGPIRLLEAIKNVDRSIKFYNAASSECFGKAPAPQSIDTPFEPQSLYAVAKCAAFNATGVYRRSYGMFAVSGLLFNHSCKYRGIEFFERKVSDAAARIKLGLQNELRVGNLKSQRDFGHSRDYMNAAHQMLQASDPKDYVVGSGETHTMEEVCEVIFSRVGLDYRDHVVVDSKFFRPAEVDILLADASATRQALNWTPAVSFRDLMYELVDADLERVRKEVLVNKP